MILDIDFRHRVIHVFGCPPKETLQYRVQKQTVTKEVWNGESRDVTEIKWSEWKDVEKEYSHFGGNWF